MNRRNQRGMAIVVAILLVALAASTAALMLSQHELWARQVENLEARTQADAVARAGIEAARTVLADGATGADPVAARELARGALGKIQAAGAELDISYRDAQALFNVNNLVRGERPSMADIEVFVRLLAGVGIAPELAGAVVDAIDVDSEVSVPGGAEDLDYLSMEPARRGANRPMLDSASLARVKGFTPDAVGRLRRLVSALPEPTAINVNSAPAEVLMAVIPDLGADGARKLIALREEKPFADIDAFRASLPGEVKVSPGIALDVKSRYYTVTSRAQSGRAEVAYQALIGRQGAARRGVVWSRQGGDG